MKTTATLCLLLALGAHVPAQDPSADEKAIREAIAKFDARRAREVPSTPDAVVWTGSLVKRVVGKDKPEIRPGAGVGFRENLTTSTQVMQLHVAESGDLAYEYSTFTAAFDRTDEQRHTAFDGARLRVWWKIDGVWHVAATFQRPYDTSRTTK